MRIALVGNQNCGKSTLFNSLTGTHQKVGNWPGVTIEKKTGTIQGTNWNVMDLPGIYSLYPYTAEEKITCDYLLNESLDCIINVIDATSFERSLYLTTQLLELNTKVIVVLNMLDILEKRKIKIDIKELSRTLHVPVMQMSALKRTSIPDLILLIQEQEKKEKEHIDIFYEDIIRVLEKIRSNTSCSHPYWKSIVCLEGQSTQKIEIIETKRKLLEQKYAIDIEQLIAKQRYSFIENVKKKVYRYPNRKLFSDRLDQIFLHKWLAIPIFLLIMALIYGLVIGVINQITTPYLESLLDNVCEKNERLLTSWQASTWMKSLINDGVIRGIGAVLIFVPQLLVLFLCISLLETSGYMSRIAFFLDRFFRKLGLSGKSLIPFIVGSGCSVPGILSTRTIENEREKKLTIFLTPFIPCSAKLPIMILFSAQFFSSSFLVVFSLYVLAILFICIVALVMQKILPPKMNSSTFVIELPEYKIPHIRYVVRDVWEKTFSFIKRAGSVIFICSLLIWFLRSFSWKFQYLPEAQMEKSMLASIGKFFSWLFIPMVGNHDHTWALAVSALQGLVAKEQVVSSMHVIAGSNPLFGNNGFYSFLTPNASYAFVVFNLFSAPCIGALSAMRKEFGETKRWFQAIVFQTIFAFVISYLVYGIGMVLGEIA